MKSSIFEIFLSFPYQKYLFFNTFIAILITLFYFQKLFFFHKITFIYFSLLLKKQNLRHIRFYDLIHSCASLLLARNIPMKAIQ